MTTDYAELARELRAIRQVSTIYEINIERLDDLVEKTATAIDHLSAENARLTVERDDAQADYTRRHNDATDRWIALRTVADFPITDPSNQDAVNMAAIARAALQQGDKK